VRGSLNALHPWSDRLLILDGWCGIIRYNFIVIIIVELYDWVVCLIVLAGDDVVGSLLDEDFVVLHQSVVSVDNDRSINRDDRYVV
jgi:hypothetical protein